MILATLVSCSAAPEQPSECLARIADVERQRDEYVERTTPQLKQLETKDEGALLENQQAFADFMTELDGFENRILVERLRCPEALPKVDPEAPVPVARRRSDVPNE